MSFLLVAAATLLPQLPSVTPARIELPDHVLHDDREDAHWALGGTYKAGVDGEGFGYYPLLDRSAAEHRPVHFTLAAVRTDEGPVPLLPPDPGRDGDVLTLDRGAILERYECRMDGVEQIIEIDASALRGAVRVEYAVETTLAPPSQPQAPFLFGDAEAGVRVGEAHVLTDAGARLPVPSVRTAAGYAIDVPAEIVATAGETLRIDPVISTISVHDPGDPEVRSIDVCAVASFGHYVVVEFPFLSVDSDIFVLRIPPGSSGPATNVISLDLTPTNHAEPAIAGTPLGDEIMVAATRGLGADRRIHARWARANGTGANDWFQVSLLDFEAHTPDIGVETTGNNFIRRYVIVWSDFALVSWDVVGKVVDRNGEITGPLFLGVGGSDETIPAVSSGSGPPGFGSEAEFRVAFLSEDIQGTQEIQTTVLDRDGNLAFPSSAIAQASNVRGVAASSANETTLPDGSSPHLVVWDSGPSQLGDLHAAALTGDSVVGAIRNLSQMSGESAGRDQRSPAIAASAEQWFVTYQERSIVGSPWETKMCSGDVAVLGFGLAERDQRMSAPGGSSYLTSVATLWEGGDTGAGSDSALAAWVNASSGGDTVVDGSFLGPVDADVAGIQFCPANPNSTGRRAWMTAFGDNGVATTHLVVCEDAPPGAACFVLTARDSAFVPNVGGGQGNLCLGGVGFGRFSGAIGPVDVEGRYELFIDPGSIPQPNGTTSAVVGETWYFQAWFRDAMGGMPVSNLSNGVAITFGS